MLYSESTGGFYLAEIHGDAIPADAVEISVAQHRALMDAQAGGARIVAGTGGFPVAEMPTPPTAEEALEARRLRASMAMPDFLDAVVAADLITDAEADEFIARTGPQFVSDLVAARPEAERGAARRRIYLSARVERMHDFVLALANAADASPEQLDAIFGIT